MLYKVYTFLYVKVFDLLLLLFIFSTDKTNDQVSIESMYTSIYALFFYIYELF